MAYCTKCGKAIENEAVVCIYCGYETGNANTRVITDSSSFGWGFVGFLIPILGLILWLSWKNTTPLKAKCAGIGALVGIAPLAIFLLLIILTTLFSCLMFLVRPTF